MRHVLLALAACAFLLLAPVASAQERPTSNIDLTVPTDVPEAIPMGAPGVLNITVAYTCGTTINPITLSATVKDDAGGTATLGSTTLTPTAVPTCTPGDVETADVQLSYDAMPSQIAGTQVEVEVVASTSPDPTGTADPEAATKTAVFSVGPYVDVTFTPEVTSFEAMPGDAIMAKVMIASNSNTMVMAMPSLEGLPATWKRPDLFPKNIESSLVDGSDGSYALEFSIEVPADANGETMLNLSLFAHSLTDTYMETETSTIPFKVMVAGSPPSPSGGGDAKESPGAAPLALVLALVALAAFVRRQ